MEHRDAADGLPEAHTHGLNAEGIEEAGEGIALEAIDVDALESDSDADSTMDME